MLRPQLTRINTTHESTRYEVEFLSLNGMWCLDTTYESLIKAKARVVLNQERSIDSRVVVVSQSRRILPS